jgi:ribosomal-protein-alanine N-acetyltransferase
LIELQGALVLLRPLAADDAERVNAWHNDAALYETLMGDMYGPTLEQTRTWLSARRAAHGADELNFAVCLRDTGEHVGNLYMRDIDRTAGTAEFHGIFLGAPGQRGKGIGRDATATAMRYALGALGLRRIVGVLLADNLPSLRAMQAVGFRIDAHLQGHHAKDGQRRDVIRIVMTAP